MMAPKHLASLRHVWGKKAEVRAEIMLNVAVTLAETKGVYGYSRREVAKLSGYGEGTVSFTFQDMHGLRDAVMRRAVLTQNMAILFQGLCNKDPTAMGAPAALKKQAVAWGTR